VIYITPSILDNNFKVMIH